MAKRKWVIPILLISSLLGPAGCTERTSTDRATGGIETEPEKKPDKQGQDISKQVEVPKPIVINVIDPNTKEIIKSFLPNYMGFSTNHESYKMAIEQWAKELARGTIDTPGYDQKMKLDKIGANGKVIKGSPKVILEETELVKNVIGATENGGDILLPLYVTESGYKPEDVAHLGEVRVASYTTTFGSGVVGRSRNIELSAHSINNVIVGTGDVFSFNFTVGPSDASHGYQIAKEIVNKKLVDGIGGGICQTSSTLFNAVDQVGVSYVEKNHHSLSVGYVPKGRDATVSYGGKDFQFKNTSGVPFLIKAIYGRGTLTVEVRTSKAYQSQMANR